MRYKYRLTEEIARWAFEVQVRENPHWDVVFTNPTAGPWKRLEATNNNGQRGEVYRFDRDEARPDIVMVNDNLSAILIIEAKDSLAKLKSKTQVRKSCKVVEDMAIVLSGIKGHEYWHDRYRYTCFNALLWGSLEPSKESAVLETLNSYKTELSRASTNVSVSAMLGIETNKESEELAIHFHSFSGSKKEKLLLNSLATS